VVETVVVVDDEVVVGGTVEVVTGTGGAALRPSPSDASRRAAAPDAEATSATATARNTRRRDTAVHCAGRFAPLARPLAHRGSGHLDTDSVEVGQLALDRCVPRSQVAEEMLPIAVLERVLELVERSILLVQKGPVTGEEVLVDHLFQGHWLPFRVEVAVRARVAPPPTARSPLLHRVAA
jgi:hypothetical protein